MSKFDSLSDSMKYVAVPLLLYWITLTTLIYFVFRGDVSIITGASVTLGLWGFSLIYIRTRSIIKYKAMPIATFSGGAIAMLLVYGAMLAIK